jgi:hypothetical protein
MSVAERPCSRAVKVAPFCAKPMPIGATSPSPKPSCTRAPPLATTAAAAKQTGGELVPGYV